MKYLNQFSTLSHSAYNRCFALDTKKKRMESLKYVFKWTYQVYYGKEDVTKFTIVKPFLS